MSNEVPETWLRPYTLADIAFIEALAPELRAVVERYARQRTHGVKLELVPDNTRTNDEYEHGWNDAVDACESELQSVHLPSCPDVKERERRQQRRRRYA